ncbi:hypothetical protein [Nocardia arthritidis]|uniref:Uncharacterized protein n=1 Tax=Nocardia arthritidis TaxID=228602 RepID=A0A6G9Y6J4_9NOCA|nr:hypothetical protein [Nocardia arthritidis]QIS08831.1 hypothetical protein F5544_04585 [Nocardia arthritidis]
MGADQSRSGAVVTCTTARIHGIQDGRISASFARTPEAFVSVAWGRIGLRFLTANAAQGVLEGFAAVRAHLIGLEYAAPIPSDGADHEYGQSAVMLTWERRTPYAVVRRDAYSKVHQRTVRWIDLHMGPVTWQIVDRTGYNSVISILKDAHRTAVAVCRDGSKFRADPTKDNYRGPDFETLYKLTRERHKPTGKPSPAQRDAPSEGAYTNSLIQMASNSAPAATQPGKDGSLPTRTASTADHSTDLDL